ncbi:hypothetical protein SAMN04487967_0746 [Natronorubrum sediminis]|uniref:Uncharacterized protein n=2 Tax=Natronorubrum sediminis TaxID=640943 RepID=A0A1H6FN10_9EURY|nr:hypothetical protein SAMN04487967_0746 [Natronorubrum sediminis]
MCSRMQELVLHAGHEHPNLIWVLVPSLLTFIAGLGIGTFSERTREWIHSQTEPSSE